MYQDIFKTFEPELQEELNKLQVLEVEKGQQVGMKGMDVNSVPFGLEGSIRVYQIDEENRESTIYTIERGQSCIVSITATITKEKSPLWAKAEENSKFLLVPDELSIKWFNKYKSWRKYVIDLYNLRIKDLINQHTRVTAQKDEIEHQNNQIVESIKYARYIQKAVLPPEELINEYLTEHFILYKPKSIVSGDFYWTKKGDDKIFFAAADATGHGVPGAFMSMLGISLMNEISYKFDGNAADFLNIMKIKIKEALRQSEFENSPKDGFDIALCIFYPKIGKLDYSGANNPLLLIRDSDITETKADRMPVGIHFREKDSFTNHQLDVKINDMLYLFSDGYRDQFGGADNQKYSFRKFKEILKSIHTNKLEEQKSILNSEFEKWKGEKDQIDDVLVFGVKIV